MKTSIGKRLLSFLLAVVMVLSLVPAVASPKAEAETATTASDTTATKDEIISLRNYAETLGWPVAVKTTGLGTSSNMTGHWMILVERSGGQMYTVNMSAPQSINIENNSTDPNYLYAVTFVTGSGAVNELHSMPQAHVLSFSGTGSSFSVQNYKKQYWYITNIDRGATSTNNTTNYDFTFTGSSSDAAKFKLITNGVGYNMQSTAGIYLRTNGHSFQVGPTHFGNPIHFYRFSDYTINLRLSMLDALPYLIDNSKGRFTNVDAHNDLVATMKAAVEAYSVHYDTAESALSAETKTELQSLNTELQSAIAALKASDTGDPLATLRNNLNSAYWPYAEQIMCPRENITAGHYMILTERGSSNNPLYGVNSDAIPDGWVGDDDAHITRGVVGVTNDRHVTQHGSDGISRSVQAVRPDNQLPIVTLSGTHGSFTLQHYNGLYWSMTNNTHWYSTRPSPTTWGDFMLSSSPTTFWINNDAVNGVDGVAFQVCHMLGSNANIIYSNGYTYRTKLRPSNTTAEGYNLEFYRFNEEALALRLALHEGLSYLVEDYGTRFDEAAFNAMCNKLNEVRLQFDTIDEVHGMAPSNMTDAKKRTCKNLTEEVLTVIAAVQRTDNEGADYIDIPIEVLDFRGDGLLFEWGSSSPYSLSVIDGALTNHADGFPGYNSDNASAGLTYATLVNGKVVHTKATVDYVAKHLKAQTALVTPANQMNRVFYDLIKSGKLTYDANDYTKTIDKCEPKIEGGKLAWGDKGANITTYHDLAYYLLSNMWRSSEDVMEETLSDGTKRNTTYNMPIDELNNLRLFKGSDGKYSFLSNKMSSAADGYIQNVTDKALTIHMFDPMFQPINNKGFEHKDLYGTATEGKTDNMNNYLFTLHAYGSFVYTEDAELSFSFTGDDDVYFFVNDQLICDIGGTHGAITKSVNLNSYAATLKLEDGQICRFDMFHADRHTGGINLNFTTNIKIMDESVVTDKLQYEAATGKQLMDGAVVPTGTEIAYGFGLTNRRSLPVLDLLLTDSKLGVTLDGNRTNGSITLNTTSIADVVRYATDLTVVYSGYDKISETVSTEPAQSLSFTDMEELITNAVVVTNTPYSNSPLGSGVYSYKIESADKLLTLLQLGLPAYCKLTIKGFRHTMKEGEFTNSLSTRCIPVNLVRDTVGVPVIEYGDPINGVASCKCQALSIDLVSANDPFAIILDYGKAVEADLSSLKDTLTVPDELSSTYVGSTFNGVHNTIKTTKPINLTFTAAGQTVEEETALYTMTSSQRLQFATKCFMEEIHTFYAVYYVTAPNITGFTPYYIMKAVSFIPATMVYYEAESFMNELSYTEKRTTGADTEAPVTTIFHKWGQEGAANAIKEEGTDATDNLQEFKPIGSNYAYGNDESYNDDTRLSNGKSLYVEGAGVIVPNAPTNDNYTQIKFSFFGTGFDLISCTNPSQGSIRVSVYSDEEMTGDNLEKAMTVNIYGELDLYQIPVVSVQGLPYRMHYVSVEINHKVSIPMIGLYYDNQFYLDAIRIYDPINVTGDNLSEEQNLAYNAYCADHEAHAVVKEIRDSLLEGAKTEGLTSLTTGAMFVDAKEFTSTGTGTEASTTPTVQISDHIAISAATYEKAGPKNEVYLSPGQAVAFKLELADGKIPVRIDVGAKTIMGDKATLAAGFVESAKTDGDTLTSLNPIAESIVTSTAMYYSLNIGDLSADKDNYLVIYNAYSKEGYSAENPANVLSVTDLKIAYAGNSNLAVAREIATAEPYFFAVDGRTLEAAAVFMKAFPETPILDKSAEIMHSLNLSGDLSINYVVSKTALNGCESFSIEVDVPVYEGNHKTGTKHITLHPVENGPYYYFTLTGITAVQMNDEIEAVLHWNQDGQHYYSSTDVYSVAQYAYSQLNKADAMDRLKTLCADLLVYGAKAQIFKGYRLDALVDFAMVETQRAYCTDPETVTFGNTDVILKDLEKPTIAWVGKTLNLGSKVTLKFVFNLGEYSGDIANLNLRVSYTDLDGMSVTATIQGLESYNAAAGQYAFSFDGLLAAELRSVVSVQIYAENEPVSCTLQYSADTYGNNKTGTLLELCKALFAYSDRANAYFK